MGTSSFRLILSVSTVLDSQTSAAMEGKCINDAQADRPAASVPLLAPLAFRGRFACAWLQGSVALIRSSVGRFVAVPSPHWPHVVLLCATVLCASTALRAAAVSCPTVPLCSAASASAVGSVSLLLHAASAPCRHHHCSTVAPRSRIDSVASGPARQAPDARHNATRSPRVGASC